MIDAGRQLSIVSVTLLACLTVTSASCAQESDRLVPRVFESLVIPSEFSSSPHAWPAGESIWIECWGGEPDQRQARDLALYNRKDNRLSSDLEVAKAVADYEHALWANWMIGSATPSELADQRAAYEVAQAEVERLQEEQRSLVPLFLALVRGWQDGNHRHPHSAITLRTANGTRYGWGPETAPDDVPVFADVEDVFPRDRGLPDFESVDAADTRLAEAVEGGDATAITRAFKARDDVQDSFRTETEARQRINALREAIDLDALEACGR